MKDHRDLLNKMFIEGSEEPNGDMIETSYANEDLCLIVHDFAGVVLLTFLSSNELPMYLLCAYLETRLTGVEKADIAVVDTLFDALSHIPSQSESPELRAAGRGASPRAIIISFALLISILATISSSETFESVSESAFDQS